MKDPNTPNITSPAEGVNGKGHSAEPSFEDLSHLPHSALLEELSKNTNALQETESRGASAELFKAALHASRGEILRELERRSMPGSAVDTEYRPSSVEFPDVAWDGLFADWRDVVAPCTEAALPKLWSALLMAIGLAIGRNVWIENPLKLFGNFYTLLIGQTGNARKSTVLWFVEQLLGKVDDGVKFIRGFVSTEGLFEVLAKNQGTRALGYVDEWRYLLSVARRKGTSDILAKMNSLYACPNEDQITRKDKSTSIKEPFFSFISATPIDYAETLLGNDEIAGGVLNRYLIVGGKEQPPKPLFDHHPRRPERG